MSNVTPIRREHPLRRVSDHLDSISGENVTPPIKLDTFAVIIGGIVSCVLVTFCIVKLLLGFLYW